MISEQLIYDAFRRFLVKKSRPRTEAIHVSEVVGCLRKAYYNRKYGDEQLNHLAPTKRVILSLGLSTHLILEEILEELGYHTESIYMLNLGGLKLVGTPDAVNPQRNSILEIKTTNKLSEHPLEHHILQLNTYQGILKMIYDSGPPLGHIIYIHKRDCKIKIHTHIFNMQLFNKIIEKARIYHQYLKQDQEPPAEQSWLCNYCKWKWRCCKQ